MHLIRFSDPIALVGIALSVGLGIALDVTGAASGVESLLAGLMGVTLSLVLDGSARAERRYRLRHMVEVAPWLPGLVERTSHATAQIVQRYQEGTLEAEAHRLLRQVTEELEDMTRGRITRSQHDYEHLMSGVENCRNTLDAITNTVGDPLWWRTELAHRYWQANEAAIGRGVRIRRVFVYDSLTTELTDLVDGQRRAGVQVAVVQRHSLHSAAHTNFAVLDRSSAWQGRMNAHAEISGNVFIVNRHDVDRLGDVFEQCWAAAGHTG
ncbi:MAG: hypothetical protein ABIS86_00835 [Streptosporangiaceae bacterium]